MTSVCCAWIKWKSHLTTSTKRKKQVAKCLRAKAKTHPYTECTDGKQRHRHWIHKSEWRSSILVKLFTVCCNKRVSRIWRNFNLFHLVFFSVYTSKTHTYSKNILERISGRWNVSKENIVETFSRINLYLKSYSCMPFALVLPHGASYYNHINVFVYKLRLSFQHME